MKELPVLISKKERVFAILYLAVQTLLFPFLLAAAQSLLPQVQSAAFWNFLYFLINFIAILIGLRHFLRRTLEVALQNLSKTLAVAGIGFLVYLLLSNGFTKILMLLYPGFSNVNDKAIASMAESHSLLMAIGTVFLVPVTEECLHRGGIFGSLFPRNSVAAYLVSSALFALVHVSGYLGSVDTGIVFLCFLQYLPAGFCLAAAYTFSGNLVAPILIHAAVNLIGILVIT